MLRSHVIAAGWVTMITASIASASTDEGAVEAERLRAATTALEAPLSFDERFPSLRFLAYLIADDARPHARAIERLALSKNPDAALPLIAALADREFAFRYEAGVALQEVPNLVALPALLALIAEDDPRLTHMAARVLGIVAGVLGEANRSAPDPIITSAIGHAQAALIELASNHESEVIRVSALTGLISIGAEDALSAVYEIGAKDPHEMVRCRVLSASGDFISQPRGARVSPAHVRTLLRKSLNPKSVDEPLGVYRRAAYESLYFSKVEPEGERRSDCVDANETAMWWLGSLNDPEAIPHLIRAAQSSDPALQAVAGWGLPRFNQPAALKQVEALLESPLAGVRSAAIEGLGRSKHPGSDARLIRVLKEGSRLDRREAARALAGSFGASLALIDAFSDRAVEVRDEAERALLRSDVVVGKLEDSLASATAEVAAGKGTAALNRRVQRIRVGLERWRGEQREAEQALAHGLGAADPRIRTRSARILSRFTSENSLRLTIDILDARKSPSSESAALALGLRGDASTRESLGRAAGSDREALSVAAIRALQDLNLKASLPLLRSLQAATDNSPRKADAVRYTIAILEQRETGD